MTTTTAPAEPGRPQPRFAEFVALLAIMMGLTAFAVDASLPVLPELRSEFAIADPNHLQLVVYVYMLAFGLAQMAYGPASDILGRRPAYLFGVGVFIVGTGMAVVARDLPTLLVARFVQGLGAAAGRVLSSAIVRDRFSGREMARVMSVNMSVFITVPVFAPAIGSAIASAGNWRTLFSTMLLSGVAVGAWFWWRMPETLSAQNRMPASGRRVLAGIAETLRTRSTMGNATAVALLFGCVMGMVGSAQQVFSEAFGLGSWFPLAFALLAASMGGAGLVNAKVVLRYGMRRISHASVIGLVILGIVELILAAVFHGHPPLWLYGPAMAGSQFLLGLSFPNLNALSMEPLGRIAGTGSSLLGLYTTIGGVIFGLAVGALYDGTVLPLAAGYCILPMLALGVLLVTERGHLFASHHKPPSEPPGSGEA